jgi:outer membrane protein
MLGSLNPIETNSHPFIMLNPLGATQSPRRLALSIALLTMANAALCQQASSLSGDVGVGITSQQSKIYGAKANTFVMPYLNLEYGQTFFRVDTFGVKTLPVGYGHLEVTGQYRGDGYAATALEQRRDPIPLGIGTLQITPMGAFWVNAFHDCGQSGGVLFQARYLAEVKRGPVSLYPEIGLEYQSDAYTRYYYGTTNLDATALGRSYTPGSAINPYVGLMTQTKLADHWYANLYLRRTKFDAAISNSPLVSRAQWNTLQLSAAYRF